MQKVERLKLICLQYAAAMQRLITSSLDTADTDTLSGDSQNMEKYKKLKLRTPYHMLRLAPENVTVLESVLYVVTNLHFWFLISLICVSHSLSYHLQEI